jgi:hypothetical protein
MSQMAVVGTRLFIDLQRLDRTAVRADRPSVLAVVDTTTDAVVGTIELMGRNAFADSSGLQHEPGTGKLLVPQAGSLFAPATAASSASIRRRRRRKAHRTEDTLGGSVTDFVIASPERGYAIVLDESSRTCWSR